MMQQSHMTVRRHSQIDIVSICCSHRIFGKASFEAAIRGRAENVGARRPDMYDCCTIPREG